MEFAAYLTDAISTATNRLYERRDNTSILEFVEKILYMTVKSARRGKWTPRFYPRIFVGILNSSSEVLIVRARVGDQNTCDERQEISWIGKMGNGTNIQNTTSPLLSKQSDNAFNIQVGMKRSAEMMSSGLRSVGFH